MKRFSLFSICITLILLISLPGYSQLKTTRSTKKPLIIIEANGDVDLAMMQLRGDNVQEFWNFTNYSQNIGFGGEIKVKMSVASWKREQLRTYFTLGYSQYSSDKDSRAYVPTGYIGEGWPGTGFNGTGTYTPTDTTGTSQLRINIPYAALGIEYAIYTDKRLLSSFNFGFDIAVSVIFGRETETYGYNIPGVGSAGTEVEHNIKSNSRFGIGLNAIYNYRLSKAFGFNVGTRFQWANLLGKSDDASTGDGKIFLLDDGDGSLNSNLINSRNIGFLRFFAGASFYIGAM